VHRDAPNSTLAAMLPASGPISPTLVKFVQFMAHNPTAMMVDGVDNHWFLKDKPMVAQFLIGGGH
jgi:hypothetical protein